MIKIHDREYKREVFEEMTINCKECLGLCCTALYFSKTDGFPADKEAGKPCRHLNSDFSCAIHQELRSKGLKGCTGYDCFGAGQKVAQEIYSGKDWRGSLQLREEMFDTFTAVRQLQEMKWYLSEAATLLPAKELKEEIKAVIQETEHLMAIKPENISKINIEQHRDRVNKVLKEASRLAAKFVNDKIRPGSKKSLSSGKFFLGANLTKANLIGADLAGALLIAANLKNTDLTGANLIGADLRDTDIRGANLTESLFLTQSQINVARGDAATQLPVVLTRPFYWENNFVKN